MSVTVSDILGWRPSVLSSVAERLLGVRRQLFSLHDEISGGGLPESWVGDAAEAARSNHTMLVEELNDRVAEVAAALTAIDTGAEAVARAKRLVGDALAYATAEQLAVDRARLVVTDNRTSYADEHERADRERLAQEVVDQLQQALRAADHADAELDAALRAVIAGIDGGWGSVREAGRLGAQAGRRSLLVRPLAGTAADAAAWWATLTGAEQQRVIEEHPRWIGGIDGIPAWARHRANVSLIPDHRAELERRLADLGVPPPDVAALLRWQRARDLLQQQLAGIARIEDLLRATVGGRLPRQLLVLDLSGERRLRVVIGVGDVDTADHVSVFVPGLDSDVHDSLDQYDQRVLDLVGRARDFGLANGSDETYAGVFWLGYEAPQPTESLDLGRSVGNDDLARDGAPDLARFLLGIDASRSDDPHLTAIGHSYGSLVTGLALRESTGVDDCVSMGSPGTGTEDVTELDVPAGHSYYLEADWDPVGDLGRFGADPSGLAGVDTLSTDAGRSDLLDEDLSRVTGHVSYLEDGSTSQYNAAAVMSGNADEVVQAPETEPNPVHRGWSWTGDRLEDGGRWAEDRLEDGRDLLDGGWGKPGPG